MQHEYDWRLNTLFFFFPGFSLSRGVAGVPVDCLPPCRPVYRLDCAETHGVHVSFTAIFQPRLWSHLLGMSSVLFSLCALCPFSSYVHTISAVSLISLDACDCHLEICCCCLFVVFKQFIRCIIYIQSKSHNARINNGCIHTQKWRKSVVTRYRCIIKCIT